MVLLDGRPAAWKSNRVKLLPAGALRAASRLLALTVTVGCVR